MSDKNRIGIRKTDFRFRDFGNQESGSCKPRLDSGYPGSNSIPNPKIVMKIEISQTKPDF